MIPCLPSNISLDGGTAPQHPCRLLQCPVSHWLHTAQTPHTPTKIHHCFPKIKFSSVLTHYAEALEPLLQLTQAWTRQIHPSFPTTSQSNLHIVSCKQPTKDGFPKQLQRNCTNADQSVSIALDYCVTEPKPGKVSKIKSILLNEDFSEGLITEAKGFFLFLSFFLFGWFFLLR